MRSTLAIGAANLDETVPSGLTRYTREVVDALLTERADLTVYTASEELSRSSCGVIRPIAATIVRRQSSAGNFARLLWHQWALPGLIRADAIQAFYSPVPEGMLFPTCPQVVTVHDLIPLLYPDAHPRLKHYYRWVVPRILRASSAVIAVSEATRADIERTWDLGDVPIRVIYQGYRARLFRAAATDEMERVRHRYGLRDFVLAVADTRPHKNLSGVVTAFSGLRLPDTQLAIVGMGDPEKLRRMIGQSDAAGRIHVLGPVPDPDLAALYSAALGLVFPSRYEGFGIPPLEAMASGCPVVASSAASLPEVCGDAALYVDPESIESIARGIAELVANAPLRATLRALGLERAQRFTYSGAARRILDTMEECRGAARPAGAASPAP